MSNLLLTAEGRQALLVAQRFQLERRLSRFFHRTVVVDISRKREGLQEFDLSTMLGALNAAHDPEIIDIFRLLGAVGGLSVSIADMTYYVDAATGSDVTGTGSLMRPFATLWFLDNLPRRIKHAYRIVLLSDILSPTQDLLFDFDFGSEGSFALIGSGAPTEIQAPTPAGMGVGPLGGNGGMVVPLASQTFLPTAAQNFLQATSGSASGIAVPIHSTVNTPWGDALVQLMPFTIGGLNPADNVRVITPRRMLRIRSIYSCCRGMAQVNRSQLAIVNLTIDFEVIPPPWYAPPPSHFRWANDCISTISFVKFLDTWSDTSSSYDEPGNMIRGGGLNTDVLHDHVEILSLANCGVVNLDAPYGTPYSPWICGAELAGLAPSEYLGIDGNANVVGLDCHCTVVLRNTSNILFSNVGSFKLMNANVSLKCCIADGHNTAVPPLTRGAVELYDSICKADNITPIASDNIFSLFGGSKVRIIQCGLDMTYSQINNGGVRAEGVNEVECVYNDPTSTPTIDGLFGLINGMVGYKKSVGETDFAWPALDVVQAFGNSTAIVTR